MASPTLSRAEPATVHESLSRHYLTDGLDIVFDLERSSGSWLRDAKSGRDYLDFMSFFASLPVGFNHPGLGDLDYQATLARAAQVKPTLSDIYTVEFARFVETLDRHFIPGYLPRVFFVEGGALAVENALKAAFDWKVQLNRAAGEERELGTRIVHFRQAFHGRSGYTLSLTNTDSTKTRHFPKFDWPRIDNPKLRFPLTDEVEREVIESEARALGQLDAAFDRYGGDVAAIIIEPIQGEGGDNDFRGEFLHSLQRVARERDCLFILDEIQTGVGLTGRMWAHEHFGLEPDLIAFGKKSQVCGVLAGPRLDEVPENVFRKSSRINSTFGGNLVDMVRFQRYLEIIDRDALIENASVVGAHLLDGLRGLEGDMQGRISNARGRGLMIAFDVASREVQTAVVRRAFERGLLLLGCGERSVRFRPALTLSREDAARGLDILRQTLKSL